MSRFVRMIRLTHESPKSGNAVSFSNAEYGCVDVYVAIS
jgi:hypothetical protein